MNLNFGDVYGMLNTLPLLNVTSRGVDKQLDNIEHILISVVSEEPMPVEQISTQTEIKEDAVRLFSEREFDALLEGVPIARGTRKRLEYLLVRKEG